MTAVLPSTNSQGPFNSSLCPTSCYVFDLYMFIFYLGMVDFPLLSNSDVFSSTGWHVALAMDDKAKLNAP